MKEYWKNRHPKIDEKQPESGHVEADELDESELDSVAGGVTWHPNAKTTTIHRWEDTQES